MTTRKFGSRPIKNHRQKILKPPEENDRPKTGIPKPQRQSGFRFHSISHSARVWFLGGLVFCRVAVAVVVVCVEPRGPVISIGILDIQMTAVMRREFGTAEPPSSEVELGRGQANGLVHVHFLPPVGRSLFDKNIAPKGPAFSFLNYYKSRSLLDKNIQNYVFVLPNKAI